MKQDGRGGWCSRDGRSRKGLRGFSHGRGLMVCGIGRGGWRPLLQGLQDLRLALGGLGPGGETTDPGRGSRAEVAEDGSSDRARAAGQREGAGPWRSGWRETSDGPAPPPRETGPRSQSCAPAAPRTAEGGRPRREGAGRSWAPAAGRPPPALLPWRSQVTDPAAPAAPRPAAYSGRPACPVGEQPEPPRREPLRAVTSVDLGTRPLRPCCPPWPPRPPPAASCCSSRCSGSPWRRW